MSATQRTQRTSSSYRCNDAHGSALRESLQLRCRLSGPYAMLRDAPRRSTYGMDEWMPTQARDVSDNNVQGQCT
jgi:hypothetical protein